ncbi:MAG TPA: 2-dehydropantoate 2-reductase [Chondromyces sp.]|nr:2-dehydropantoate 2-reductase [Chondromyces sp.]
MKIGIVGGGAIGLFYAANLSRNFQVQLLTKRQEQARAINEKGLCMAEAGQKMRIELQAVQISQSSLNQADFLFIAVKQYQLQSVIPVLSMVPEHVTLVFLQNGMGHLEWLGRLPQKNIFVCTVEHGVLRENDYTVQVRGRSLTNIACIRGTGEAIEPIVKRSGPDFPFVFHDDPEAMLLEKLAVNIVINPLTALLKVENGEIADNVHFQQVAFRIFQEFADVFSIREHSQERIWKKIMEVCQKTSKNRSSMLRDIEEHRPLELDAIVGYVLTESERRKVETPVIHTIYYLLKGLDNKGE